MKVGEYFCSSAVVGSSRLNDRTMLDSLLPMTPMPVWLKPTADNSSVSSERWFSVRVALLVAAESSIDRIFCAASE